MTEGASVEVCEALGIPPEWAARCENSAHVGHDGTTDALRTRLDRLIASGAFPKFDEKMTQLGSYGGGNHFGECEVVELSTDERLRGVAETFGLRDGGLAFLSHCGSRGFGHNLAMGQFRALQDFFARWGLPLPGEDKELVYAPLGTPEADAYLDDMALAACATRIITCATKGTSSKRCWASYRIKRPVAQRVPVWMSPAGGMA